MRFRPCQRIRHRRDFLSAREHGVHTHCGPFILRLHNRETNPDSPPRLGIIASRRVGKAHDRNRAKRLFREIFRENQGLLPTGIDVIIVVRSGFDDFSLHALADRYREGLDRLLKRLPSSGTE